MENKIENGVEKILKKIEYNMERILSKLDTIEVGSKEFYHINAALCQCGRLWKDILEQSGKTELSKSRINKWNNKTDDVMSPIESFFFDLNKKEEKKRGKKKLN